MNAQHAIGPVMRSVLIFIGFSGIGSLMFFGGEVGVLNWFALATIIPLILGMLGDNLVLALFDRRQAESVVTGSHQTVTLDFTGNGSQSSEFDGTTGKAA